MVLEAGSPMGETSMVSSGEGDSLFLSVPGSCLLTVSPRAKERGHLVSFPLLNEAPLLGLHPHLCPITAQNLKSSPGGRTLTSELGDRDLQSVTMTTSQTEASGGCCRAYPGAGQLNVQEGALWGDQLLSLPEH